MNNHDLCKSLQYAKDYIQYYQNNIKTQKALSEYDDKELQKIFESVPIVDKTIIQSNYTQFIRSDLICDEVDRILDFNRDFNKEYQYTLNSTKVYAEYTSGTTGTPFVAIKSDMDRLLASKNLWKQRNKIYPAKPTDLFSFIHTFAGENLYPFPFEDCIQEPQKVMRELEFLNNCPCSWWHVNAYILEYYYRYLQDNQSTYPMNALKVIENCGSYISEEDKERYSKMFHATVTDYYGCREVWCIAYTCKKGHLHICEDFIKVELIDENGNIITEPNKVGKVLLTSLKQKAMPFIRYSIGDYASYEEDCMCGEPSKCIKLFPERSYIVGTKLYGSVIFKNVVSYLNKQYKISNFSSISVKQDGEKHFTVNIKKNMEDKERLEKSFIESVEYILKDQSYSYRFTYDDNLFAKSIFTVGIKK